MGYSIWDRINGGPATSKRYLSRSNADKASAAMNAKAGTADRFYVKPL